MANLEQPEIIFVKSPQEAQRIANRLCGTKNEFHNFGYYLSVWDYGWCAEYDFFTRIGVLNNEKFNEYLSFIKDAGIYDTIQFDKNCIVCEMPTQLLFDENQKMHNINGYAIEWSDGYGQNYFHGISTDNLLEEDFASMTEDKFKNLESKINELPKEHKVELLEFIGKEKIEAFFEKSGEAQKEKFYQEIS